MKKRILTIVLLIVTLLTANTVNAQAPVDSPEKAIEGLLTRIGGNSAPDKFEIVIDAAGKIVAPGFIDMHTHSDISMLLDDTADRHPHGRQRTYQAEKLLSHLRTLQTNLRRRTSFIMPSGISLHLYYMPQPRSRDIRHSWT